jgi:hypothetical protein
MTKLRMAPEQVPEAKHLPDWLVHCVLTGILAGLGGAASLLFGLRLF